MSVRHFRVELEYDGTGFSGWQVQPGARTVQGDVEQALRLLTHEEVRVHAAGRTDAGVHALGQVISFSSRTRIDARQVALGLNRYLPADVRARRSDKVPAEFHARFSAQGKTYGYTALIERGNRPLLSRFAASYGPDVDVERMREAAALMVGEHEFAAFAASGGHAGLTVRTVYSFSVDVIEGAGLPGPLGWPGVWGDNTTGVRFVVTGSGFLYKMVRNMVGTLMEVGQGKIGIDSVVQALATGDRQFCGTTAPAQGLVLVGVDYGDAYPWSEQRAR